MARVRDARDGAATMWRDLFGRRTEPSADVVSALADLDRLVRERPDLESPARVLGRVLVAAFGVPALLLKPYESRDLEAIRELCEAGEPLFTADPPAMNPDNLRSRAREICHALKAENPSVAAILKNDVDWFSLASQSLREGHADVPFPEDLVRSILRLAMMPVLASCSSLFAKQFSDDAMTSRDCPLCGSVPSLAESRGLEARRVLRCGVCAGEWSAPRLGCAACGETNARAIRTQMVEGDESRYRLVRCDSCGFSLKVVSTLKALSAPGLLVAELATIHLDFLAET